MISNGAPRRSNKQWDELAIMLVTNKSRCSHEWFELLAYDPRLVPFFVTDNYINNCDEKEDAPQEKFLLEWL